MSKDVKEQICLAQAKGGHGTIGEQSTNMDRVQIAGRGESSLHGAKG